MSHILHAFLLFLVVLPYVSLTYLLADCAFTRKALHREWPAYLLIAVILLLSHFALAFLTTRVFV